MCLLATCISSLECRLDSFSIIKLNYFVFSLLNHKNSLYILNTIPHHKYDLQAFSLIVCFLDCVLQSTKGFSLMKSNLSTVFLYTFL